MSKKIMGVTVGTPIRPSKFASELADRVEEMVKANTEQEKTVDITENGTFEIVPDVGYKLTKVTANVNVSGDNKLVQLVDGTLTEITAEDLEGITEIRDYAFYSMSTLTNIALPNTITEVGSYAFYKSGITSLVFPNSVAEMGADVCESCQSLTNVVLPENTQFTTVPNSAFRGNSKLKNVVFPNNITRLDNYSFYNCWELSNITLPNNLQQIGSQALYGCQALTELTIPASVTNIGGLALQCNDYGGSTFTFLGTTPPTIATNTFWETKIKKIIVPVGCGEAYKTATNWSNFADFIEEAAE